jgi:hypothetical protein
VAKLRARKGNNPLRTITRLEIIMVVPLARTSRKKRLRTMKRKTRKRMMNSSTTGTMLSRNLSFSGAIRSKTSYM